MWVWVQIPALLCDSGQTALTLCLSETTLTLSPLFCNIILS